MTREEARTLLIPIKNDYKQLAETKEEKAASSFYELCVKAIDMAISALEKQIPMPVRITTSTKRCGNCGRQLSGIGNIHPERKYCVGCGQAIDWGK